MSTQQKILRILLAIALFVGLVCVVLYALYGRVPSFWGSKEDPSRSNLEGTTPPDLGGVVGLQDQAKNNSESYVLDYGIGNGEQSTVVLSAQGTVEDRYAFYEALLKEEGWLIKRAHADPKISFLYGEKPDRDINITISPDRDNASLSKVSISMYKK